MPKQYAGLGVTMLYPDNWKMDEDAESEAAIFESPEGAFLSLSRIGAGTSDPIGEAQAAMASEYERVEEEVLEREVAGQVLTGVTQRFVFLDLIVTSHLTIIEGGESRYLVQMQGEDRDMDKLDIVFNALLTSLCQSLQGV